MLWFSYFQYLRDVTSMSFDPDNQLDSLLYRRCYCLSHYTQFSRVACGKHNHKFDRWHSDTHMNTRTHACTHTSQLLWVRSSDRGRRTSTGFSGTMVTEKRREFFWLGQGVLPSSEEHTGCIQGATKQWFTTDQLKRVLFHEMAKFNWPLAVLC